VGASGDVQAVILGVHCDVVPAAVTTNRKGLFDRPGALRGNAATKRAQDRCNQKPSKYIPRAHEILQLDVRNQLPSRIIPRGLKLSRPADLNFRRLSIAQEGLRRVPYIHSRKPPWNNESGWSLSDVRLYYQEGAS
jgi:hypothetical protein